MKDEHTGNTVAGLTPRQKQVLDYLKESIELNGYAPSYREMAHDIGVVPSAAHRIVRSLEERGHLKRGGSHQFRTITLTDRKCPHCGEQL